jgi:DNA-binding transcriptional regulator YiaG
MPKNPKKIETIPLADAMRSWQGARTQAKAADDLGVNVRTYQNWVQGRSEPRGIAYKVISSTVYESAQDKEDE